MRDSKGKYYFLPVDNLARVEIVPKTRTRLTRGLGPHILRANFLRPLKEIPELNLNDGDILEPVPVRIESTRKTEADSWSEPKTLKCKILRQPGREIRLPLDCGVPFELFNDFDPRSYTLRYVADNIAFPVAVRFIGNVEYHHDVRIPLRGEFCFEEVVEESIVIATTKVEHNQFTILKLPLDLQVTLFPIRKLYCNAKYIARNWKYLQDEIDKLEKQITTVENDLFPSCYFKNDRPVRQLKESGGHFKAMKECMPVLDGLDERLTVPAGHGSNPEKPTMPSLSHKVDECRPVLEGDEHDYETIGPSITAKQDEYISVPERDIGDYESVQLVPDSIPYSSARSRQGMHSKNTQDHPEKPLYSSLTSIPQSRNPRERPPHVYAKLKRKSKTACNETKIERLPEK